MAYFDKYGVEFSDDRKILIRAPQSLWGEYCIPNSVTRIENNAFWACLCLTNLKIPNSVTSIGEYAFHGCAGLKSVNFPNSIEDMGNNVFRGCTSLTSPISNVHFFAHLPREYSDSYVVPNGIKAIAGGAFWTCVNLTDVSMPTSVINIGDEAFSGCTNLANIHIPDSVKRIGKEAFRECNGLTSIHIPEGVTSIGDEAFRECKGLMSVSLPSSIICIRWPFFWCANLKEIRVPKGQKTRFLQMAGLEGYADIIVEISNKENVQDRISMEQRRIEEQQMQEMLHNSILFFDTETTGTPRNYNAPVTDSYNWPRLVQLAWIMADDNGNIIKQKSVIIKPQGYTIPLDASAVHGITTERAEREGKPLYDVLSEFILDVSFAKHIVGHNIDFDKHIIGAELYRLSLDYNQLMDKPSTCTMKSSTDYCAIPKQNSYYGGYKWPSLQELYRKLFNRNFEDAHDALADITATKECFFELRKRGVI